MITVRDFFFVLYVIYVVKFQVLSVALALALALNHPFSIPDTLLRFIAEVLSPPLTSGRVI